MARPEDRRPTWDQLWLEIAVQVSRRSLCSLANVGAVIVDWRNRVVSSGYNNPPAGFEHGDQPCADGWCDRGRLRVDVGEPWLRWRAMLTEEQRWSHCGSRLPHDPHVHTVVMNEGPYPDTRCVGSPVFGTHPSGPSDFSDCPSLHAEANALMAADRSTWQGGTMYVTKDPCVPCAKLVANSGLARLVVAAAPGHDRRSTGSRQAFDLLHLCGVEVILHPNR